MFRIERQHRWIVWALGAVVVLAVVAAIAALVIYSFSRTPEQYFASGEKYFAQKRFKEAIVEFRNAIQKNPSFGKARYKLAESYAQTGDSADAINAFREYVRAGDLLPNDNEAQLKAGQMLLMAGRSEEAKACAERVLKRDPRHVLAHVLLGQAVAGLKDLDGAIAQVQEAIELDPGRSRSYSSLGVLQLAKGDRDAAERAFKQAVEIDPKSVGPRLALGYFYWGAGRLADAEQILKQAVATDPKHASANRYLAAFYLASDRTAEAEAPLRVLAEVTGNWTDQARLAEFLVSTGRQDEGMKQLEKLAKNEQAFAVAKTRMASLLYLQGKRPDAHKVIDEVIYARPNDASALATKARFLLAEHRLDEALGRAQKAVTADAKSAMAQYTLAQVYEVRGDTDSAIKALNEVLALNPRAVGIRLELSELELARGASQPAVNLAEDVVKKQPNNWIARLVYAQALMAAKDLPGAEAQINAALKQNPNAARAHAALGTLRAMQGDRTAARREFERAVAIDATTYDALEGLVALDLQDKRNASALAFIEGRLARAPKDPTLLILAARTYYAAGDAARAERALLTVLEVDSTKLDAYGMLGQLYFTQKKLDLAREKFEQLARQQSRPVAAQTMVAMILEMQGKRAEAEENYRKVLAIDTHAAVAANNLAWIYVDSGRNLDIAADLARTAQTQLPDSPEANDTLGWIYYKSDLTSMAIRHLTAAAEKMPGKAIYHYHLGLAKFKVADFPAAKKELEQALALKPDFDGAAEARRMLALLR
jgi:tetratricopeptide (TPR) repeat protein